jgi:hypothetical protein
MILLAMVSAVAARSRNFEAPDAMKITANKMRPKVINAGMVDLTGRQLMRFAIAGEYDHSQAIFKRTITTLHAVVTRESG